MTVAESEFVGSPYLGLNLRQKEDLQVSRQVNRNEHFWVVGDPVSLEFYRFNEHEYALLNWCDGERSLNDLKELFEEEFAPYRIKHREVQSFVLDLYQKSLLVSTTPDQGRHLYQIGKKKRLKKLAKQAMNPLAIRWKGINPDRLLDAIEPYTSWFFSLPLVVFSVLFMLSALGLVLTQYQEFARAVAVDQRVLRPSNWLGLILVIATTKIIHELFCTESFAT